LDGDYSGSPNDDRISRVPRNPCRQQLIVDYDDFPQEAIRYVTDEQLTLGDFKGRFISLLL